MTVETRLQRSFERAALHVDVLLLVRKGVDTVLDIGASAFRFQRFPLQAFIQRIAIGCFQQALIGGVGEG